MQSPVRVWEGGLLWDVCPLCVFVRLLAKLCVFGLGEREEGDGAACFGSMTAHFLNFAGHWFSRA